MENRISVKISNEKELKACKHILELCGYNKTIDFEHNTPYYITVDLETKYYHSAWMANNALDFTDFINFILAINESKN